MDVCILGRIGYDLYAVQHNLPLAEVEQFTRDLGGSSANIAVGLARLGLKTGIISCLGKDALAPYLLGVLAREGVDTRQVQLIEGYNTSLCLTEVWPPNRFTQVFYRREPADSQVTIGPDVHAYIRQSRMFVTNGTALCASPSRKAALEALRTARDAGLRTVFDIDYRASSWPSPEEAGLQARQALPWTDIVLGNEEEILLLTGEREAYKQARTIMNQGVGLLVRKLGARGVEAEASGLRYFAKPISTRVICTVGAGDGFAAGFLSALLHDLPLDECLRRGNAAAAIVVSRVSCAAAMPYPDEIEALLRSCATGK